MCELKGYWRIPKVNEYQKLNTSVPIILALSHVEYNLYIYCIMLRFYEKIFYNRSTNSPAFCVLQWIQPPFPSMQLK